MAELDAAERKRLKPSTFAGPDRSYPVPDKSHAANAKARASEMYRKGKLTVAEKEAIDRKADAVLAR